MTNLLITFSIIAYISGSLSSAILVARLLRLPDPRTEGSRNPGASNMLRLGGRKAAALTLFGDTLKGFVPVFIASSLNLAPHYLIWIAFAAVLGHLWPIFFRFSGGKGIATWLGALIALNYVAAIAWASIWLLVLMVTRYISLASLISTLVIPVIFWLLNTPMDYLIGGFLLAILIAARHHDNIRRLLAGNEHKIGSKN